MCGSALTSKTFTIGKSERACCLLGEMLFIWNIFVLRIEFLNSSCSWGSVHFLMALVSGRRRCHVVVGSLGYDAVCLNFQRFNAILEGAVGASPHRYGLFLFLVALPAPVAVSGNLGLLLHEITGMLVQYHISLIFVLLEIPPFPIRSISPMPLSILF